MEESMVERVARAMCRDVETRVSEELGEPVWKTLGHDSLDSWTEAVWPNYASQARVAIEAMRDYLAGDFPSAMDDAYGAKPHDDHPCEHYFDSGRFSAMIQAALTAIRRAVWTLSQFWAWQWRGRLKM